MWGLSDIKKDIQHFSHTTNKFISSLTGKKTNNILKFSSSLPIVGEQVNKWRSSRMKTRIISSWNIASSKIIQAETIFYIWLEAIQVKKRILRSEALKFVDELESLICFHENRLDMIDDLIDEAKELAVFLKKRCNHLAAMKSFHEECNLQKIQTETVTSEQNGDEDIIFRGYSTGAGTKLHSTDLLQFQSETISTIKQQSQNISNSPTENEINSKLNLSIEVRCCCCVCLFPHSHSHPSHSHSLSAHQSSQ